MNVMVAPPDEAERKAALRRMRIVATGLLVVAAIIYIATLREHREGWLGFVNAASEAAMVGALADWFAVTALFRHPLGIPIPHTALIKRRKDDLGRGLQSFVTANFLTAEIFRRKVAEAQLSQRLADWLAEPAHRQRVVELGVRGAQILVERVGRDDVRHVIEDSLLPRLHRESLSPVAGAFLEGIVADDAHHGLVDVMFREFHGWLTRHPDSLRAVLTERAPSWTPGWMDRRVVEWGYQQVLTWAETVRDSPHHEVREAIDELLAQLAQDLQGDEAIMERAESLKERMLDHPAIGNTVESLWVSLQASLVAAMEDHTSSLWIRADDWVAEIGRALRTDAALREAMDARIEDVVGFVVTTYGSELATVISSTVERWDPDEAADRIESFVGRDLQFIRINGTIVGALAGVCIHALSLWIHG